MTLKVTMTITTLIDDETFDTEHAVEVTACSGVPEDIARAAAIGGSRALLKTLEAEDADDAAATRADQVDALVESADTEPVVVVHKSLEVGENVYLDEDIYDDPPVHSTARVYLFEQYDSDAPADSNCTLVNVETQDWTVRGIGELVPVDELISAEH